EPENEIPFCHPGERLPQTESGTRLPAPLKRPHSALLRRRVLVPRRERRVSCLPWKGPPERSSPDWHGGWRSEELDPDPDLAAKPQAVSQRQEQNPLHCISAD